MNQDQFVARRQEQWQELSRILGEMQRRGVRRLPLPMVEQVGKLYRQTASDLAYARTYFPGTGTVHYLNRLVSQAHAMIYAEEPRRLKALWLFFSQEVPQTVRRHWFPVALAAALMIFGGLVGYIGYRYDRGLAEALVDQRILETVVSPQERYAMDVEGRPLMGTFIMQNNIKVGILSFASGVTLGIGPAILQFYNGTMIGVVMGQAVQSGHLASMWAHLMAHGSLELMAIWLCGAAGMVLGWSIVAPGNLPRAVSVSRGGRQAVILFLGAVPFFVVAALIEGFVTPAVGLPDGAKALVAVVSGLLGLAYWLLPGRRSQAKSVPAP